MEIKDKLHIPTSIALRNKLQEMVYQDLHGPAGGPYEEIDERNVQGRYILGLLAPKPQTLVPDEQDDLQSAGANESQDGKTDNIALQMASMLPSSFGLIFSEETTTAAVELATRWDSYRRVRSDTGCRR